MTNKYQQNPKENKDNNDKTKRKNQNNNNRNNNAEFKNNSDLVNKNSYMKYELNNTFKDKTNK